jgi:hypothetical protein
MLPEPATLTESLQERLGSDIMAFEADTHIGSAIQVNSVDVEQTVLRQVLEGLVDESLRVLEDLNGGLLVFDSKGTIETPNGSEWAIIGVDEDASEYEAALVSPGKDEPVSAGTVLRFDQYETDYSVSTPEDQPA